MLPQPLEQIVGEIAADIVDKAAEIEACADAKEEGLEPGPFGIAVVTREGEIVHAGAAATPFPIQSIAKVFALEMALCLVGRRLFERVGREPSGDPFNSIIDLERTKGIPRNPFVNAGALVIVDILVEQLGDDMQASAVMDFVRGQMTDGTVGLDDAVLATEHDGGDLNRAMMSFMRHHGNLHSPLDEVMEAYVHQCAIALDCRGLAQAGLFLTRTRRSPDDKGEDERAKRMREVSALMMTCGHYDGSGDFALRVGLPAKSGVGGGILAIAPEIASIAVWSPNLDQHGNSMLGVRALEMLSHRTGWSVFGPPL
ncbi:glutaminase A [Sphingomonas jatrophae]|uniref:Glutaminase n=1 Tax=Sphingomonas jatrophae TaxID=1166337 RepID=A0A1I6JX98_9SPHN|nr:glutaminase A [Sphingomonas jatrophae]SFR83566.1 L-glutaminase [Sphingomonas jatrophae]